MNKLFTLGCSLTYNMGWKELLCENYDLELVNSSMFAGSNGLQVRRIHSYIVNNQINKDDIIVWQITGQLRYSFSINADEDWMRRIEEVESEDDDARYHIQAPRNYFSGNIHQDILSNHPLVTPAAAYFDFNASMEELISTIILLNNTYNILIIIGWEGALTEASDNYDKFIDLLSNNNVPHLKESYLDWAIRCKQPLADDLHPTTAASKTYGETVLFPTLRELGWI